MSQSLTANETPDGLVDASAFAAEWWGSAEGRRLPGEAAAFTVFAIEFWDGCRYVGVTDMSILDAVDDLVASPFLERRSLFVSDHCGQMGYVVRCVASDVAQDLAEQLRSALVEQLAVDSDPKDAPEGQSGAIRLAVDLSAGKLVFADVRRCAGDTGFLIDTKAVSRVVTDCDKARFELENWRRRWDSNPRGCDEIWFDRDDNTFVFFRIQTDSVRFSKRAFCDSINKKNRRSCTCFTSK